MSFTPDFEDFVIIVDSSKSIADLKTAMSIWGNALKTVPGFITKKAEINVNVHNADKNENSISFEFILEELPANRDTKLQVRDNFENLFKTLFSTHGISIKRIERFHP